MIYTITLNPAIDHILFTKNPLEKRKNNRMYKKEIDLGGKGLHVSHTLTCLNIHNTAITFAGRRNASSFKKILDQKNLHYKLFIEEKSATRITYVLMDQAGEGSLMVTEHGFRISEQNHKKLCRYLIDTVKTEDTVILSGSLPPEYPVARWKEIVSLLKERRCTIACDVSGEALRTAVEMQVDFIKPNEQELRELFPAQQNVLRQLQELNQNVPYVVFSKGGEGSTALIEQKIFDVDAPKVKECNDTGAGDVFVGALFGAREQGCTWEEALTFAAGCSASKVTKSNSSAFDVEEAKVLSLKTNIQERKGVY
ncbi:1-phosphofructokinase family hexose kinase [Alteribacillus bidgolensis]|uniref:Tagatose-6-phosphate kinase n=1 Tax=Alteribacillus bidgolensis TaxID=930129 RepID=A0A1G8PL33_9BACI|nr:hexose kinase [Alteribacillus bidgolensis]SDI92998.1 1-phosphofructokinase [Alteribacillus bidgolensis]